MPVTTSSMRPQKISSGNIAGLPQKIFAAPNALTAQLALFWCSALLAVPFAYSRFDALIKLSLLTLGVLLFYALPALPGRFAAWIAPGIAGLGATIAVLFLLAHDWQVQPADYAWINRLARAWMALRPDWLAADPRSLADGFSVAGALSLRLNQNVAGGLLAALLPFAAAWAFEAWLPAPAGSRRTGARVLSAGCLALMAPALVLSSSRAALLGLAAAGAVWIAWRAGARLPPPLARRRMVGAAALLAAALALGGLALARSGAVIALFDSTPGFPSAASRADIITNSLRLAADFPFVGGGLRAFPGLYAVYMQGIPFYLFGYSHNLYLDVAIEQGLFGLLALLGILAASLGCAAQAGELGAARLAGRLGQAAFTGLLVLALHGLADDPFYGEYGTPLLFLLPAVAVYAARLARPMGPAPEAATAPRRVGFPPAGLLIGGSLALAFVFAGFFGRRIVSQALANLGAVKMAQVQLAGFPRERWDEPTAALPMDAAAGLLRRALAWNPDNRSANQRLGLLALQRADFETALPYLSRAYRADPGHRGVVKNLGYCLTWLGRYEEAGPLLRRIPEAAQELGAYAGWWPAHARPDLAQRARSMQAILTNEVKP